MSKFLALILVVPAAFCLSAAPQGNGGEGIYQARCLVCHGKDGVPKSFAKGSPAFNDEAWQKSTSVESIEKVIADGRNKMPAFRNKLTQEEIRSVAAYVKTL